MVESPKPLYAPGMLVSGQHALGTINGAFMHPDMHVWCYLLRGSFPKGDSGLRDGSFGMGPVYMAETDIVYIHGFPDPGGGWQKTLMADPKKEGK